MVLVVPATNQRENCFVRTNSARSTTFRRRVGPQLAYVSRSTSRHFPILVGFDTEVCQLGCAMCHDGLSEGSPGAGVAWRGSVLFGLIGVLGRRFGTIFRFCRVS